MAKKKATRKRIGRPPLPKGQKKVPYATKLEPIVVEFLQSRENQAATIEARVKNWGEFKKWREQK